MRMTRLWPSIKTGWSLSNILSSTCVEMQTISYCADRRSALRRNIMKTRIVPSRFYRNKLPKNLRVAFPFLWLRQTCSTIFRCLGWSRIWYPQYESKRHRESNMQRETTEESYQCPVKTWRLKRTLSYSFIRQHEPCWKQTSACNARVAVSASGPSAVDRKVGRYVDAFVIANALMKYSTFNIASCRHNKFPSIRWQIL